MAQIVMLRVMPGRWLFGVVVKPLHEELAGGQPRRGIPAGMRGRGIVSCELRDAWWGGAYPSVSY